MICLRDYAARPWVLGALVLVLGRTAFCDTAANTASVPAPARPNIVFILADDVGLDDIGCYGSDRHKTPHIDRLAASGLRFETCYAAPVCGPSRCLLMTGRYAFRTGGLGNQSWRQGGPGARSTDEYPIARLLRDAGYATGMAGKWRQLGERPSDWGFDEYLTDPSAEGWYWQTEYFRNGKRIDLPNGTYGGEVVHDFAVRFMRRHKDEPFFFYYAMHHVHEPIQDTPDTGSPGTGDLYEDNIRYMDKQVGAVIHELERLGLREKTLVMFSGDNGTAPGRPSPIGGRMLHGHKGTMLEGGARVPLIANWPGVTPAGRVIPDIVSFADPHMTFAELAGAPLPPGIIFDGQSFAPQLRGESGTPRPWAYVQWGDKWYVREPAFKLNEQGQLFDMSGAPFEEVPVPASAETPESSAARQRLATALYLLNPGAGKSDPLAHAK